MNTILFPKGAFGSTIEYCLRNFSQELESIQAEVQADGSMHSFSKEFHPIQIDQIDQRTHWEIATPLYTGLDHLDPLTTVQKIKSRLTAKQNLILIYFSRPSQVHRNYLFTYYKTPDYVKDVLKNKPRDWNPNYTCVADMQPYEIREALSLLINETEYFLQVINEALPEWLCVTPDDILYNFKNTIITILEHCNLTLDPASDIDNFYKEWFEKQQYILEEFQTIQRILKSVQDRPSEWAPLSIMGEAIVQHCLRTQGIEIACHGLNQFPTSTEELKRVMIKGTQ